MVMTVDDLSLSTGRYKNVLEGRMDEILLEVYEEFAFSDIPDFERISNMIYATMFEDLRLQLIDEALGRNDHDLFGWTEEEYVKKAYAGEINDVAIKPYIDSLIFFDTLSECIVKRRLFVQTRYSPLHQPIQGVW